MEPTHDLDAEPTLLLLLDGLVRRGGAVAALRQEVCIGVEREDGHRWWHAEGGLRRRVGFIERCSPTAHATLCLSEADADRLIATGQVDFEAHVHGDRDVMRRFIERYTRRLSAFGARVQSVEGHRRLPRNGGRR